jgi:hypothetical protein
MSGGVASLYRADCPSPTCGPATLHRAGKCTLCGHRAKQPKVARRLKPPSIVVAVQSGEYWAKQRKSTPARRTTRGAGIVRA